MLGCSALLRSSRVTNHVSLIKQCLVGDKKLVEIGTEPGDHAGGIADLDGVAPADGNRECRAEPCVLLHVSENVATDGLPSTLEVVGIHFHDQGILVVEQSPIRFPRLRVGRVGHGWPVRAAARKGAGGTAGDR